MNLTLNKGMVICVSCRKWDFPKYLLIETEANNGEKINDIAKRAFEKAKTLFDEEINLVSYNYYGKLEIVTC